jgi:hypothetical protein
MPASGARLWELRAAMGLSGHYHREGKEEGARKTVAYVYGWLTEGFTPKTLNKQKRFLMDFCNTL